MFIKSNQLKAARYRNNNNNNNNDADSFINHFLKMYYNLSKKCVKSSVLQQNIIIFIHDCFFKEVITYNISALLYQKYIITIIIIIIIMIIIIIISALLLIIIMIINK